MIGPRCDITIRGLGASLSLRLHLESLGIPQLCPEPLVLGSWLSDVRGAQMSGRRE
jgi:hypothetical protein